MTTPTSEAERYVAQEEAQLIGRNYPYVRDYRSAAVARRAFLAGWAAHAERVRGLVEALEQIIADADEAVRIKNEGSTTAWFNQMDVLFERIRRAKSSCAAYDREGK